ncbi:MAG TPA: DUF2520 domain-containing protein [Candidatus Dormibacteraeota bacterium]|nr:DUF2520 domain-containing protein [Candidatus Dormibacteraeota bacterium]
MRPSAEAPPPRPRIAVVGAGRCGSALAVAAHEAGYPVTAVTSRTPEHARALAGRVGAEVVGSAVAATRRADLILLTVPDAQITRVAATIAASGASLGGRALVHCSGAHPSAALAAARHSAGAVGSLHPLQSLTGGDAASTLRGTYFAIEADARLQPVLERLVADLGGIPFTVPAAGRVLYHAAAVLAGNAPLALVARATSLLESAGVDPAVAGEALATLLEGAARNARRLGVRSALTGPVVRNDAETIDRHLEALRRDPDTHRLYRELAGETLRTAGSTGREQVAAVLAAAEPRATGSRARGGRRRGRARDGIGGLTPARG